MTASGRRLDRLADLEEQREFLLRSLSDLDVERDAGELDSEEYELLRDDYTRRAAEVLRAIDEDRAVLSAASQGRRDLRWVYVAIVVVVAVLAGVAIAQSLGTRRPGDSITGEIDRSARSVLNEARIAYAENDLVEARELVDEVLITDRDLPDALLLSAQIHERNSEVLLALQDLDSLLEVDPEHIDALTLRGWILVNIPDEDLLAEGIRNLDTALALEPTTFDPFMFRGFVARAVEGDLAAAIEHYNSALEREPPPQMQQVIRDAIAEMEAELAAS